MQTHIRDKPPAMFEALTVVIALKAYSYTMLQGLWHPLVKSHMLTSMQHNHNTAA
jgi:hypothetical protein